MTDQELSSSLDPQRALLAPLLARFGSDALDMLDLFFKTPAHAIDPGAIAEVFCAPLGHAWALAADDPDQGRRVAQAGLDVLKTLFDRIGADEGPRAFAHGQWWRVGIQSRLEAQADAPFEPQALADWLARPLSPQQLSTLGSGICAVHLLALCPRVDGLSPEQNAFFGHLGQWFLRKPRILLLDEPTRGVDVGAKREIYRIICEFAAAGGTVVMISSEIEEVLGLSDRIMVMRGGRSAGILERTEANAQSLVNLST